MQICHWHGSLARKCRIKLLVYFCSSHFANPIVFNQFSKATHTGKNIYIIMPIHGSFRPWSNYRKLVLGLCAQFNAWRSLPPSCPCPIAIWKLEFKREYSLEVDFGAPPGSTGGHHLPLAQWHVTRSGPIRPTQPMRFCHVWLTLYEDASVPISMFLTSVLSDHHVACNHPM